MGFNLEKTEASMNCWVDPLLIIIPVFNHGTTLKGVVEAALSTGFPVLVVDDGSSDGGVAGLAGLNCQVESFAENRGKGAAILAGARIAKEQGFASIITLDADAQHNPLEARDLAVVAAGTDHPVIVIGARRMVQDTVPGLSLFGRDFSNFWVRLECGADLPDTQSGMRLYPVDVLLAQTFLKSRYDFEIEVLVKSVWAGVEICSVPISVHYPPAGERVSHFHKFLDNWRLTLLHTGLVCRRLLPFPHKKITGVREKESPVVVVKKPLRTLQNLCRENSSPFWLALAVWMGLFVGASPLIGVHTVAIIYLAYRFHLNKVAAVAASQFCMPPVVPALCIEVGHYFQTQQWLTDLSWKRWLLEVHYRLWDWFVGFLFVGPILGLFGGGLVYWLARRFQQSNKSAGVA